MAGRLLGETENRVARGILFSTVLALVAWEFSSLGRPSWGVTILFALVGALAAFAE